MESVIKQFYDFILSLDIGKPVYMAKSSQNPSYLIYTDVNRGFPAEFFLDDLKNSLTNGWE